MPACVREGCVCVVSFFITFSLGFFYISPLFYQRFCVCVCVFGEFFDDHFATFPSLSLSLSLLVIFKGGSFGPAVQRSIILTAPAARAAFLTSCYKFVFFFFSPKRWKKLLRVCVCKQTTAVDVERTVLVKKVPGQQNKKTTLLSMAKCEPCLMDGYGSAAASLTPPMP